MRLEAAVPENVLAAIRAPFQVAGGEVLETPLAEPLAVYLDLAGEALRERLFVVQQPEREDHCLRPDFTVGVARTHIASGESDGRYIYEGHAFRVAPADSMRSEQFLQIGLETFGGEDGHGADADAVLLAWRAAREGGREDLVLVLGDVALFRIFLEATGVAGPGAARLTAALAHPARLEHLLAGESNPETGALAQLLVGLEEVRAAAVLEEIWSVAGIEPVGGRKAPDVVRRLAERAASGAAPQLSVAACDLIRRYLAIKAAPVEAMAAVASLAKDSALDDALSGWELRLNALAEIPADKIRFAAAFHRPFGYYDGMLFEVRSAALGDDQPVAAGGRYDGLPTRLGAASTAGAVGCMVRPGRAWKDGGG